MKRIRISACLFWVLLVLSEGATGAPDEHRHDHAGHGHDEHGHNHDWHEHAGEVRLTAEAVDRFNIRVEAVELRTLQSNFIAPARVAYNGEAVAHVGAAVRGRAAEVKARIGATVTRGDVLLVVESPELGQAQSDFLQKRTAAEIAEAAIEPLLVAYDRSRTLHENSEGMALAEVQRRAAELAAARGAYRAAKANVTAAENALHLMGMDQSAVQALVASGEIAPRYAVRAPLSGQVIEREVTLGELVSPDKDALLILADLSTVWVLADVPEARLGEVAIGNRAAVSVAVNGQSPIESEISHISTSVEPDTRTARVRIEVPNPDRVLRPGMFASAGIASSAAENKPVLAIPQSAVHSIAGQTAVFVPVEGEPNTFVKTPVTVGPAIGGFVPVLSGLEEGDKLVTTGSFILKAELSKTEAGHGH